MAFSTLMQSVELGLIFAILALGLFIAFRVLDLPDMEERVTIQGGNFSLTSAPGKGTTVSFSVPLRDQD